MYLFYESWNFFCLQNCHSMSCPTIGHVKNNLLETENVSRRPKTSLKWGMWRISIGKIRLENFFHIPKEYLLMTLKSCYFKYCIFLTNLETFLSSKLPINVMSNNLTFSKHTSWYRECFKRTKHNIEVGDVTNYDRKTSITKNLCSYKKSIRLPWICVISKLNFWI